MQKRIHPALSKLADLIIRGPLLLEQDEAHKKQLYDYWDGLEAVSAFYWISNQAIHSGRLVDSNTPITTTSNSAPGILCM